MRRLMDLRSCAVRLRSAVVDATWASQRVPEVTRSTLEALSTHGSLLDLLKKNLDTVFDQCAAETNPDRFVGVLRHVLAGGLRLDTLKVVERAAGVASTALDRAYSVRRIVGGVIDRLWDFEKWCVGGPAVYDVLRTLLGDGDAATEGLLGRLIVGDLDTLSRALVPITQQALLADEPSVPEVLKTFDRTVVDVWIKLDAADTPSTSRRALVIRVADIARRPGAALGLARRHTDALRAALSGDATAQAALASVDARCGTATDAASVELRGRIVAALGALAGGAETLVLSCDELAPATPGGGDLERLQLSFTAVFFHRIRCCSRESAKPSLQCSPATKNVKAAANVLNDIQMWPWSPIFVDWMFKVYEQVLQNREGLRLNNVKQLGNRPSVLTV